MQTFVNSFDRITVYMFVFSLNALHLLTVHVLLLLVCIQLHFYKTCIQAFIAKVFAFMYTSTSSLF